MDAAWLRRLRWRRRGAWMWPAFIGLTFVDGLIGSQLPPAGDAWDPIGAGIAGCALNLLGIVVVSVPLGLLLRRRRPDMPKGVARDYGATTVMLSISALLLVAGVVNQAHVHRDSRVMADALTRARAFIGDRAPDRFRRNVDYVSTYAIQPGSVYRMCVPSVDGSQTYCVIVRTDLPFSHSVTFGGYEPNSLFGRGVS